MDDRNDNDSRYVDDVQYTDNDIKRREYLEKHRIPQKQRSVITLMAVLCCLVCALIVVYVIIDTGNADILGAELPTAEDTTSAQMLDTGDIIPAQKVNLPETAYPDGLQDKYKALYAQNNDYVGWLRVKGTGIDFPVVQAPDRAYDYYLRKLYDKSYSRYGQIFMDYRCAVSPFSKNTIIYGHHFLSDGLFFADVEKYQDVNFYKTASLLEFDTIYADYKWKICACFVATTEAGDDNGYVFDYIYPFMSDQNFTSFMEQVKQRSFFWNPAVDIQPSDKILVLSTCTYMLTSGGSSNESRCVLVARLVRDGESAAVDVSQAYQNDNVRMPQLYYDIHGTANPYKDAALWYPSSD